MSQENVELVRRIYGAWEGGDVGVALEGLSDDVEWDLTHHRWPGPDKYHGKEGVVEVLAEWIGMFEDYRLDVEDILDAGERVIAIQRERAWHRDSRAPIDRRTASIFTVRDGKATRIDNYLDVAEALEAAGLSE